MHCVFRVGRVNRVVGVTTSDDECAGKHHVRTVDQPLLACLHAHHSSIIAVSVQVQAATRVAVSHMISQMRILDKNIARLEREVAVVVKDANDNETRFGLAMKLFTTNAQSDLSLLRTMTTDMEEKLEQVCVFVG